LGCFLTKITSILKAVPYLPLKILDYIHSFLHRACVIGEKTIGYHIIEVLNLGYFFHGFPFSLKKWFYEVRKVSKKFDIYSVLSNNLLKIDVT